MTEVPPEIVDLRLEAAASFAWRKTDKAKRKWGPDLAVIRRLTVAEQAFTSTIGTGCAS